VVGSSTAPVALRFMSLPQSVGVGACSAATMVGVVDAAGNRTTVSAATPVDVTPPGGVTLYADAACTLQSAGRFTIPAGGTTTSFYFRAPNVGTYTLIATSSGLASASQDETVR